MSTIEIKGNTINGTTVIGNNNVVNLSPHRKNEFQQKLVQHTEYGAQLNEHVDSVKADKRNVCDHTVFISYSWDNDEHRQWVGKLAKDLISKNIHVIYDQNIPLGTPLPKFMNDGIRNADRVLIIGSPNYLQRSKAKGAGCLFEDCIVTEEIFKEFDTTKFIPLLRSGNFKESFPALIANRKGLDFSDDAMYGERLHELIGEFLRL
ncbi:MAG: toll/interleukin-1 receptor domain-containing protein [Prevotella sp.]|nr:toll/interleukin-1 receptor domain-containing protein [Prevotella sp.]